MFNLKRNRQGELLLNISFDFVDFLTDFFVTLNKVLSSKIFYLIPMGLGIGFGIGMVVFSQPSTINAQEENGQIIEQSLVPKKITLETQNFTSLIDSQTKFSLLPINWQNEVVYFANFHSSENHMTTIATKKNIVEKLKLGDKILIEGTNQGQYQFSVTQTKQVFTKDFYQALSGTNEKLVIISPQNFIGTELLLAFAK